MATQIKSSEELRTIFLNAVQDVRSDLTDDEEGSILDTLGGAVSAVANECSNLILDEFKKTFFATANGPEVTEGSDDLEALAVDHFGDDFARPAATAAEGVVAFSRPTSAAGTIAIPAGTVVKTQPNSNGESQRFATQIDVALTNLTVNASVTALEAGEEGNVEAATVTVLESTLLDSSIGVSNAAAFSGGAAEQDDSTYRETIRNLITSIRGATLAAIEAKAETVSGVELATAIETTKAVIEYDIATDTHIGTFFRIPYVSLYIADANGTANNALLDSVRAAVDTVRAAGVQVNVLAATALPLNWTASMTLNPTGPNYAELSSDPQMILDAMEQYINELPIGTDFVRATANAAILAVWGPAGTDDLTAFTTSTPVGDVTASAAQKIIAGTLDIS